MTTAVTNGNPVRLLNVHFSFHSLFKLYKNGILHFFMSEIKRKSARDLLL